MSKLSTVTIVVRLTEKQDQEIAFDTIVDALERTGIHAYVNEYPNHTRAGNMLIALGDGMPE